jgi:hypothetical protein
MIYLKKNIKKHFINYKPETLSLPLRNAVGQRDVRLVSRAPVVQWEVQLGNVGLLSAEPAILANWRD